VDARGARACYDSGLSLPLKTKNPLHPRLFDVTTPIEFRHVLAAIMNEISQQK
jgi:hypothetical protein